MVEDESKLKEVLLKAKDVYSEKHEMHCPYFNGKISLTADGFNHLQYKSNRNPRNINEQILKLLLLKKALDILPKCGTLQEYRTTMEKIGNRGKNGFFKMKKVQYWGFHAILDTKLRKIKIIVKQTGDGKIIFWSVMPYDQKLFSEGIEDN